MITYLSLQQDGETALHKACKYTEIRSAVQLIEAGADLQVTDKVKRKEEKKSEGMLHPRLLYIVISNLNWIFTTPNLSKISVKTLFEQYNFKENVQ